MISFLRYFGAALALKFFSATPALRRLYRALGNKYGQNLNSKTSEVWIDRGLWLCQKVSDNHLPQNGSQTVLELGTGWTHSYPIFLRMFFEFKSVLFDIQDNRQFDAMKRRIADLAEMLPQKTDLTRKPDYQVTETVAQATDFDDLYERLDMSYITDPNGRLNSIPDNSVDVVFSFDVLEHVFKDALPDTMKSMYRVLKPGGLSIHQIGLDDHLTHYAAGMSSKNYLRYSNATWSMLFENDLQYFNRVQLQDFLELFEASKLDLIHCQTESDANALIGITPAPQFLGYDLESLQATRALIVHRKPGRR